MYTISAIPDTSLQIGNKIHKRATNANHSAKTTSENPEVAFWMRLQNPVPETARLSPRLLEAGEILAGGRGDLFPCIIHIRNGQYTLAMKAVFMFCFDYELEIVNIRSRLGQGPIVSKRPCFDQLK